MGNIEQRVFDAFPPYPHTVTIYSLAAALPEVARVSVYEAVRRLKEARVVEQYPPAAKTVYRLCKNARRPHDMRGHHGKSGRKRKPRAN